MKIKDIEEGKCEIVVMIRDIQEKKTKNDKPYVDLVVTDGETDLVIKCFGTSKAAFAAEKGNVINLSITTEVYNGGLSSKLVSFEVMEGADKTPFVLTPPIDTNTLYNECMNAINGFTNIGLRTLVSAIYTDYKDKLLYWSAAKSMHHNIYGGLLWHTYRMLKTGLAVSEIYNVDKDLVCAGILLHDIGKLDELDTDDIGTADYTTDGNLFGHLYLGTELIRKYAEKLNTEKEVARELCHIVASHHGIKEYGAISEPHTIEAYFVSEIDMLDSRAYMYENAETTIEAGEFTDRGIVDGIRIYKSANKI